MDDDYLSDDEGVDVTRIEWDRLDSGRWRWTVWSKQRRLHSVVVPPERLKSILTATGVIVFAMAEKLISG